MSIEIRAVGDLGADWRLLWPLLALLDAHHAELLGLSLREHREDTARRHFERYLTASPMLILLAFDGAEPIGCGVGRIINAGWSGTKRMGHLGDFFILPRHRGSTLVLQMHRRMEGWMRSHGVEIAERDTIVENSRAYNLWQRLGYLPVLHKLRAMLPLEPQATDAGLEVRSVKDFEADWPLIERFILRRDESRRELTGVGPGPNRASWHRERLEKDFGASSRFLVAEAAGEPAGIALVRASKNPWIFEERKGSIRDVEVSPGFDRKTVIMALMNRQHAWLVKKGTQFAQRELLAAEAEEVAIWRDLGYMPFIDTLRKRL